MSYEDPTPIELYREALLRMMCDLSEDNWCAGWLIDLEYILWWVVLKGDYKGGFGFIGPREAMRLKNLHKLAGGWWIFVGGDEHNRFVPTDEWLRLYAAKEAQEKEATHSVSEPLPTEESALEFRRQLDKLRSNLCK